MFCSAPPKGCTFLPPCNLRAGSPSADILKMGMEKKIQEFTPVGNKKPLSQAKGKFVGKDSRGKEMSNSPRGMFEQTYPSPKKRRRSADLMHELEVNQGGDTKKRNCHKVKWNWTLKRISGTDAQII